MAISDRLRGMAGRAGGALQRFAQVPPRRLDDVGLRPNVPAFHDPKTVDRIESPEGLTAWVAAGAGPVYDRQQTYPADFLDPQTVDDIFKQADKGFWLVRYADFWHDLTRRDYQIYSLDRGRRVGITTKRFLVQPFDARDPVAVGLASAVRAMVDQIDGFDTAIYGMLSANGPGYSLMEPVYQFSTIRFPVGGRSQSLFGLHPRELRWSHPRHLSFDWSSDAAQIDLGHDGKVPLASAPHKFIVYETVGDGIVSSRGFLRPCAWLHLMKHTSLVSGAIFLKLFGIPSIRAFIKQEAWKDAGLQAEIKKHLQDLGNGVPSTFPDFLRGMIDVQGAPVSAAGVDVHMKWVGFLDACMAKAIQGAVLQSEASGNGPGSYALGAVHENRSYDVSVVDSIGTCEKIRSALFWAWIDLNLEGLARILGAPPEYLLSCIPKCFRRIDRETTPKERAEIAALFAKGGLAISKAQLRNEYAWDPPDDDDDAFKGEPVTIASGGAAVASADAADGVKVEKDEPERPAQE